MEKPNAFQKIRDAKGVNYKTYILQKNIIHYCPFTVVKEVELNATETIARSKYLFFQIRRDLEHFTLYNNSSLKIQDNL